MSTKPRVCARGYHAAGEVPPAEASRSGQAGCGGSSPPAEPSRLAASANAAETAAAPGLPGAPGRRERTDLSRPSKQPLPPRRKRPGRTPSLPGRRQRPPAGAAEYLTGGGKRRGSSRVALGHQPERSPAAQTERPPACPAGGTTPPAAPPYLPCRAQHLRRAGATARRHATAPARQPAERPSPASTAPERPPRPARNCRPAGRCCPRPSPRRPWPGPRRRSLPRYGTGCPVPRSRSRAWGAGAELARCCPRHMRSPGGFTFCRPLLS